MGVLVFEEKRMVKIDPHEHERGYRGWKAKGMPLDGVTEANAALIRQYLADMEIGANVGPGSKRGARGWGRLRNVKSKLQSIALEMQESMNIQSWADLEDKDRELLILVQRIREGQVRSRRQPGEVLTAAGNFVKALKSFWHWYQRVQRKQGRDVKDVTIDLDGRDAKPTFNYFTIEQLKKLCDAAKQDYRVMMMFLFDTGIRAPTEMMNVRVSDLEWSSKNNIYTLTIREETSKTFGRRIKLMLCSDVLRAYLALENLQADDYIFTKTPQRVNQYLKRLAFKTIGIGKKVNDGEYDIKDGLTLYDFRHSSACYWLPRYKSESALKYRFGWKKSDMIHYYTELLGMHDTIQEEDLYIDVTKTELEQQIGQKGKEIELLQEQLKEQDQKMKDIMELLQNLQLEKIALQRP